MELVLVIVVLLYLQVVLPPLIPYVTSVGKFLLVPLVKLDDIPLRLKVGVVLSILIL